MVGKTNLVFISKGEEANIQLIQKSYSTMATGEIFKLEEINGNFFAFADKCYVLTGTDMDHLDFVKKDNENLQATHIVYAEENYYIMSAFGSSGSAKVFATADFNEYVDVGIEEIIRSENEEYYNGGLFLDSKGNIVIIFYELINYHLLICVCKTLKKLTEIEIIRTNYLRNDNISSESYRSFLVNDKIYFPKRQYSLSGANTNVAGLERYMYTGGYFFKVVEEKNLNTNVYEKILYRSRDGVNMIRYNHELPQYFYNQYVVPISGKYGCIYTNRDGDCFLNIADDIMGVGYVENQTIRVYDTMEVKSVLEYDDKTYMGTQNGIIYEFQLDYEGVLQRPDVTIIKTLSAKQALAQSIQYTDNCVLNLRNYIDQKIQDGNSTLVTNSNAVELENNVD